VTVYARLRIPPRLAVALAGALLAVLAWPFPGPGTRTGPGWPVRPPARHAAHARIVRITGGDLLYPDGVRVSLGAGLGLRPNQRLASAGAAAVIPCTAGYTCLYEHVNYGGRRLEWQDPGLLVNLADYDFNDQMSSWRNLSGEAAIWYHDADGLGLARCMPAGASNPWVGSSDNDQASSLRILTRTTC